MTASDDSSAPEARSILAGLLVEGQQIILAAAMVGDADDFTVWSRKCRDWTKATGGALTLIYGEERATRLGQATAASPPAASDPWQELLMSEVDRVEAVVGMIGSLSREQSHSQSPIQS
jgi:hypothetical protein